MNCYRQLFNLSDINCLLIVYSVCCSLLEANAAFAAGKVDAIWGPPIATLDPSVVVARANAGGTPVKPISMLSAGDLARWRTPSFHLFITSQGWLEAPGSRAIASALLARTAQIDTYRAGRMGIRSEVGMKEGLLPLRVSWERFVEPAKFLLQEVFQIPDGVAKHNATLAKISNQLSMFYLWPNSVNFFTAPATHIQVSRVDHKVVFVIRFVGFTGELVSSILAQR